MEIRPARHARDGAALWAILGREMRSFTNFSVVINNEGKMNLIVWREPRDPKLCSKEGGRKRLHYTKEASERRYDIVFGSGDIAGS